MTERIFEFLSNIGLPGIFVGVFLEAIGLPFPGSVLVILAGVLSKQGEFTITIAWLISLLGYLLGSISAFMLGRHIGEPFIERWGKYFSLTPERMDKAQKLLQKSAPAYIICARFLPTIGNITPYVAGLSGISTVKFLIYDMVHAMLWLTIFLGLGVVLGNEWYKILNNSWFKEIAIVVGLLILAYTFRNFLFARNKNKI